MATPRRRLDRELVARGFAADPVEAAALVADRRVLTDGALALTPDRLVAAQTQVHVLTPARQFASRGGEKLAGALDDLSLAPQGKHCLDAGAGHGGFTDCLLQRGAASVVAVDVGYGDFDWTLRTDARVRLVERCNIRTADPDRLGAPFDLVVADL
ncbi:MAG: SAM-dependent methyltransferase, partial [Actinomycetota bacterium]